MHMSDEQNKFLRENWLSFSLVLIMLLLVVVMVYLVANVEHQTKREAALEAGILTGASIIASILATKVYAELGYSKSLRDHGVQIASGITVLKRQIESLSEWVAERRAGMKKSGASSYEGMDAALEHVECTLDGFRSMTDTALRAVAGLIGGALAEYEAIMEQIGRVRLQAGEKTSQIKREIQTADSGAEVARLQAQIEAIALQTEEQISRLALKSALPIPEPRPVRKFDGNCPYCQAKSSSELVDRPGTTERIVCKSCGQPFNVHVLSGHKIISRPVPVRPEASQFLAKAKGFLVRTQAWLMPQQVEALVPLVTSVAGVMKAGGEARSPFNLQGALFREGEKLIQAGVGRVAVRTFLKLLFQGQAFRPPEGVKMTFRTSYVNDLDEPCLLNAYVMACVSRVSQVVPLTSDHAPELGELLFEGRFEQTTSLVERAIARLRGTPQTIPRRN